MDLAKELIKMAISLLVNFLEAKKILKDIHTNKIIKNGIYLIQVYFLTFLDKTKQFKDKNSKIFLDIETVNLTKKQVIFKKNETVFKPKFNFHSPEENFKLNSINIFETLINEENPFKNSKNQTESNLLEETVSHNPDNIKFIENYSFPLNFILFFESKYNLFQIRNYALIQYSIY